MCRAQVKQKDALLLPINLTVRTPFTAVQPPPIRPSESKKGKYEHHLVVPREAWLAAPGPKTGKSISYRRACSFGISFHRSSNAMRGTRNVGSSMDTLMLSHNNLSCYFALEGIRQPYGQIQRAGAILEHRSATDERKGRNKRDKSAAGPTMEAIELAAHVQMDSLMSGRTESTTTATQTGMHNPSTWQTSSHPCCSRCCR